MAAHLRCERMIDLTLTLGPSTMVFPGDPPAVIRRVAEIERGDPLTASELVCGCHVGTHVDAPGHFVRGGALLEDLPLSRFMGPAQVIDRAGPEGCIGVEHLRGEEIAAEHHVLIRTRNSALLQQGRFRPDYTVVSREAIEWIARRRPRSIGFDYYSLDPVDSESFPAHREAARAGIPVYVCLDLSDAPAGRGMFVGLPLRLEKVEASMVRAVLIVG